MAATVQVKDLIDKAEEILQDTTNVKWSQQSLLDYVNDAQREIVLIRPDANVSNEQFTLAQSAKQTLPADALRLLSLYKNASPTTKTIQNRSCPRKSHIQTYRKGVFGTLKKYGGDRTRKRRP